MLLDGSRTSFRLWLICLHYWDNTFLRTLNNALCDRSSHSGIRSMKYSWLCMSSVDCSACSFLLFLLLAMAASYMCWSQRWTFARSPVICFSMKFSFTLSHNSRHLDSTPYPLCTLSPLNPRKLLGCFGLSSAPWPRNFLQVVNWGNSTAYLISFPFLKDHCPVLPETCCFIYFVF